MRPTIAVPIGDPAGIGPEIVLRAITGSEVTERLDLVIIGEVEVLRRHAKACGLSVAISSEAIRFPDGRQISLKTVSSLGDQPWEFGQVSAATGRACRDYAISAIALVQEGAASAVVAAPHTEAAVNQAGYHFRGYPSLVAEMTGTPEHLVFLMLLSPVYRVVNVTLHEPLIEAAKKIDENLVLAAIRAAQEGLGQLGIKQPRIGVCGLNPHAGEGGLMGTEDIAIIVPAISRAVAEEINVEGPISADALFAERSHDVYLAMYHDQGHIPVKVASPLAATAITIGTPVPFGSVAHGSALDIAGTGRATPRALIQALLNLVIETPPSKI
ncbi:PdxA family dehydrogenase [Chromohalobacter israelensis]|uniref:PdxA family dehydrogenase n=1 Tax=Chromohalobacter israelensis TaxID=141390 RepID=UPI001CC4B429|nr:4-hydroxythreonine-4-phosphate dehydrogenase PdxA [Chromohalobacter salexigens]MBZ5876246.1 4-hydroxythreonine-4-phosphate dehydrogenase PdxA [Chromohalobacter salexigens]